MPAADTERRRRLEEAIGRLGPWEPPHNIHLGDGVWTITDQQPVENSKLRRVVQLVADVAPRPIHELRILDLACEGGIYGIELARLGAEVVAVEGRDVHVQRARFAAEELGLSRYSVERGDVREVTAPTHGSFDVVLCLGILYHLDAPDVFDFIHAIAGMCTEVLILDTSVSLRAQEMRAHGGHEYWGRLYTEHSTRATERERIDKLRASLDNPDSFWLTKPSLYNLIADAGFTSVLETRVPRPGERHADRVTLVAGRGAYQAVPGTPNPDDPPMRWPEREALQRDFAQTARGRLTRLLRRLRG